DGFIGEAFLHVTPLLAIRAMACLMVALLPVYLARARIYPATRRRENLVHSILGSVFHSATGRRAVSSVVQSTTVIHLRPGLSAISERQPQARLPRSPAL